MNKIDPDILARIMFLSTKEGGKTNGISGVNQYGCVFNYKEQGFDCRLLLNSVTLPINPGTEIDIPIKFLYTQNVKPKLKVNELFTLWEGIIIAKGIIIKIY